MTATLPTVRFLEDHDDHDSDSCVVVAVRNGDGSEVVGSLRFDWSHYPDERDVGLTGGWFAEPHHVDDAIAEFEAEICLQIGERYERPSWVCD